jgi:hypothetical protein
MYATATKMAMKEEEEMEEKFDPLKHVKNPTAGEKKAAKDVKRSSYADRAAMLRSAQADGRLKEESVKPGEFHHIDWDGKSHVHVSKVEGDNVHLIRLNRPIHKDRSQPVRPEDKIVMSKKEFHASKLKKEEIEEQAPVAPSLMKHRISVTVSDPDHTMVSKRKEKIQKTVIVTHSDNKQGAQKVGEKFYKKKGYVVHDSHHAGMVNEEKLEEALDPSEIAGNPKMYDASTVKKAYYHKSTSASDKESLARHLDRHHGNKEWRKPVKEELDEKFINGREYASHGLMHPDHAAHAVHKVTGQSIDFYAHGTGDKVEGKVTKNDGKSVHIKDTKGTTHKFKVQRGLPQQKNEDVNFDEQGNLMAEKLKFADFIAKMNEQLLEYETDSSGVYRHTKKATYGTSYQGDDDEDEKPKKAAAPDAPKRGRGRPAGSTGASYKPRSAATAAAAKAKAAATKAANKK